MGEGMMVDPLAKHHHFRDGTDIPILWNCGILMFLLKGADVQILLFVR